MFNLESSFLLSFLAKGISSLTENMFHGKNLSGHIICISAFT
jgi:hypothetical protein